MATRHLLGIMFPVLLIFAGCKEPKKTSVESLIDRNKIKDIFHKDANRVRLDHLYIVLDSSSYSKFISNMFIKRSYAGLDMGMPKFEAVDCSATTVYLRGEKEYIEILGPDNIFKEPIGQCGVGFSLNGQSEFSLKNEPFLKEEGTKFLKGSDTVSFKIKDSETIWYKAFYTYGMRTNLYTWYSYYNPQFLTALHGKEVGEYSPKHFLQTAYEPDKLFKQITEIELRCTKADYYRIAKEFQLLGCALKKRKKDNLLFRLGKTNLNIVLDEHLENSMVSRIDGLLNRKDDSTINFKQFKITNKGHKTSWIFGSF